MRQSNEGENLRVRSERMCHAVKSQTSETLTRVVVTLTIVGTIGTGVAIVAQNANTQIAELYQLQAAFHEATSGLESAPRRSWTI